MPGNGRALLIVRSNVVPNMEEEYNRWYNEVHLRDMLSVPGVLTARRYVSLVDEPKYAAVYELESEDVLQSEAYLTIPNGRRDGGLPSK
jgi:hypothetical protein